MWIRIFRGWIHNEWTSCKLSGSYVCAWSCAALVLSELCTHLNLTQSYSYIISHYHLPRVVLLCAFSYLFFFFTLWGPNKTPPDQWSACPLSSGRNLALLVATFSTSVLTLLKKNKYRQDLKMFIPTWYHSIGLGDMAENCITISVFHIGRYR